MKKSPSSGASPGHRLLPSYFLVSTGGLVALAAIGFFGFARGIIEATQRAPSPEMTGMEKQVAAKIEKARQEVIDHPDTPEAWGRLGMTLHAHELQPEAASAYRRAMELGSGEFRWPYLLAQIFKDSDPGQAILYAEVAARLNPSYVQALVLLGELHEQANEWESSFHRYEKASTVDSRSAAAEFGLGRLYLSKGDVHAAREHLERARKLQGDWGAVRAFLARAYHRLGERTRAAREAETARTLPAGIKLRDPVLDRMEEEAVSTLGYQNRALRAEAAGDLERAKSLYRRLLRLKPADADVRYTMGNILSRSAELEQAERYYRQALELDGSHVRAHINLGNLLTKREKLEQAARHYEMAIDLEPGNVVALTNLGNLKARSGRVEEGIQHLRKALELQPGNPEVRYNLGQILAGEGKLEEAIAHLTGALRVKPLSGAIHRDIAMLQARRGDYRSAWEHVKRARELGETIPREFIEALASRMPEPKEPLSGVY